MNDPSYVDRMLDRLDAAHERGDITTEEYLASEAAIMAEANERPE